MIPLGTFAPDMAETNPGVSTKAENVTLIRDANGIAHGPMKRLAVSASATELPSAPRGGVSAVDSSGSYGAFVGTQTDIYRMSASYELDASTSIGTGYSVPAGDYWSFARFGSLLHATNTTDGLLKIDVDNPISVSAVSGGPQARYIFPAFNVLFALDCNANNKLILNSAIGNSEIWNGKGAGYQIVPDGEELMAGAELSQDFAIIVQRNAVRGLYRRGDGRLYDIRKIADGRGAVSPRAFTSVDGRAFWLDTDGFWMFSASEGLRNIGLDRVNRWFIDRLATDGLETVEFAVDKVYNRIAIRYQASDAPLTTRSEDMLFYWYLLDEWSTAKIEATALFQMASPGYTSDDIDSFGLADTITIDVDSRFWAGGEPRLAALNGSNKFGFFDGSQMASSSQTGSMQSPVSMMFRSITPLTDAAEPDVGIGVRDRESDEITWKNSVKTKASGRCPVRARGKLVKFQIDILAGNTWTYLRGLDYPEYSTGGPR